MNVNLRGRLFPALVLCAVFSIASLRLPSANLRAAGFILPTAFAPGGAVGTYNDVGRELAAGGNQVIIGDAVPDPMEIKTVTWNLAPAGVPIGPDPPGPAGPPLSVAPPMGALAAIQAAFTKIDSSGNRLIFTPSALTAASHNSQVNKGNIIDVFFADLGPNVLGATQSTQAVTVAGGGNLTVNNVDVVLGHTLSVFDPLLAPAGYDPVVNPLVNPYATFTGDTQGASPGDIESTFMHEVLHALGLQHPDRTVQNFNTNARYTRNYATSLTGPTTVGAALSFQINEDSYFDTGILRTVEGTPVVTPLGLAKDVNPNNGSSAVIDSIGGIGEINRTMTPDDNGGLAYIYQDFIRQQNADTLQAATSARYVGVTIESDWSRVAGGGNTNNWIDDPAQTTRNDLAANAQLVGIPRSNAPPILVLGSIAGIVSGAESGLEVVAGVFNSGDVDYYEITARGGAKLLLDIDEGHMIGNSMDSAVEIFDSTGAMRLAVNDDDAVVNSITKEGSLSEADSAMYFTLPGMGLQNFLIKVSSVGAGSNMEGDYLLKIYAIPEPTSWLLLAIGGLLFGWRRHCRPLDVEFNFLSV